MTRRAKAVDWMFLTVRPSYLFVFVLVLGTAVGVFSQSPAGAEGTQVASCNPKDYRVLTPGLLALRCNEGDVTAVSASGRVDLLGETTETPFSDISLISPVGQDDVQWLSLQLAKPLAPRMKYRLVLQFLGPTGKNIRPQMVTYDFNTNETACLAPSNISGRPTQYELTSNLAFREDKDSDRAEACAFRFQDFSGKTATVKAMCTYLNNVPPTLTGNIARQLAAGRGLEQVGQVTIDLSESPLKPSFLRQMPLGLDGLSDVFGNAPKLDPKSRFVAQRAPATKDASRLYANVSYAAGAGSRPAWALDGKLAVPVGSLIKGFQLAPFATADIGQNGLSTLSYADTIRFGLSATKVIPIASFLQETLVTSALTYETDRELDRSNLLAIADLRYNFAHLYNPQNLRSLQEFARQRQLPAVKNGHINLQPENIKTPLVGYALDWHTGFEAGGALLDTQVRAGSVSRTLPAYNIVRFVPQVHGLLQVWRFSVDATITGRYLVSPENTVIALPNRSLGLEKLSGWKAYSVINNSISLDSAGHFAITVAHKDGCAPPRFQRVNTIQAGFLVRY
jgi:hypothetical protein